MPRPRASQSSAAGRGPRRRPATREPLGGAIASLLAILDAAYDHHSWHGTNLRGSLRGLTLVEAAWRPAPGRHNIWELAVHAAYWKYIGLRRLTGAARGSFVYKGSDWFTRPETNTAAAWKQDLAVLDAAHRELRSTVAALAPDRLRERPAGSTVTNFALISGVAAHDLYHAGQIQLLKRLCRDRIRRR
jgi:uncharacterized damage-inducible protein DinB